MTDLKKQLVKEMHEYLEKKFPKGETRLRGAAIVLLAMAEIALTKQEERYEKALREVIEVVDEQAEDEGLWFMAIYASEKYLQQELRRLHEVIESAPIC